MRRAVFGSARKFCPSARLGARPCRSRSAGIVAGVNAIAATRGLADDVERRRGIDAGAERARAARTRRGCRSMMWPVHASGPRSPTRHCAVPAVRVSTIVHDRAERQAQVGAGPGAGVAVVPGRRARLVRRRCSAAGAAGGRCVPEGFVPRRRIWVTGGWTTSSRDHGSTGRSGRPCGPRSRTRGPAPLRPGLDRARCGRRRRVGSSRYSVGNGRILSSITVSGVEPVDVHGRAVGEARVERRVHLVVRAERDLARREQLADGRARSCVRERRVGAVDRERRRRAACAAPTCVPTRDATVTVDAHERRSAGSSSRRMRGDVVTRGAVRDDACRRRRPSSGTRGTRGSACPARARSAVRRARRGRRRAATMPADASRSPTVPARVTIVLAWPSTETVTSRRGCVPPSTWATTPTSAALHATTSAVTMRRRRSRRARRWCAIAGRFGRSCAYASGTGSGSGSARRAPARSATAGSAGAGRRGPGRRRRARRGTPVGASERGPRRRVGDAGRRRLGGLGAAGSTSVAARRSRASSAAGVGTAGARR